MVTWLPSVDNGSAGRPSSASILRSRIDELRPQGRHGRGHPAATEQARRNVLDQLASLLR
jgi:hypothetical protein